VEADDGVLLLLAEVAALDVRAQVVDPPEPAALAAPQQPCSSSTRRLVSVPTAGRRGR
jgi:hypothetical protein